MTHLKAGDKAPPFSASDQNGKLIDSAQLKGKKFVLYFYPNDDSETCTKEACNFRDNYSLLKKSGYTIIGVSHAPVISKKKFADKYKLPFTLLADTDLKIVKDYGVYGDKLFMGRIITTIHRITFIVNEKGIIDRVITKVTSGNAAKQILEKLL
ncbi:MAG: thioredoxin-dependent thiol peroxidase [Bacteroidetes bacterium]|nr:thioredoxin-dependent thiol peroxidase [Bacteroidota bacterium]MBP9796280.1 thioredoxin-dependent thiol peroxidase [Chitinophagales bacterium]